MEKQQIIDLLNLAQQDELILIDQISKESSQYKLFFMRRIWLVEKINIWESNIITRLGVSGNKDWIMLINEFDNIEKAVDLCLAISR